MGLPNSLTSTFGIPQPRCRSIGINYPAFRRLYAPGQWR
ncbi:hypothetical protein ABIB94_008205 [Bradyrhizobium sp. JR7.2]